jgi:hypothetical protein
MCGLIFSTSFVYNFSYFQKNSLRDYHKFSKLFMQSDGYFCLVLMKLEFSQLIFEKY